MAEVYLRVRGQAWNVDYLSAARAEELYAEAKADEHARLKGSPDDVDGFTYLAAWHESAGSMVRVRVWPVAREHVPAAELARLEAEWGAGGNAPTAGSAS